MRINQFYTMYFTDKRGFSGKSMMDQYHNIPWPNPLHKKNSRVDQHVIALRMFKFIGYNISMEKKERVYFSILINKRPTIL